MNQVNASPDRLRGVDAARGGAMVLVCLSHFVVGFFTLGGQGVTPSALGYVGMVASPTFMLISGMMAGLLYETRRESFNRVARTLAGRGIFLLTVGHALILLTVIPRSTSLGYALGRGFITDVIGVAILVGPVVVQRLGIRGRLNLSIALMMSAWLMTIAWIPSGPIASGIRYMLVGPWNREMNLNFPLLPWLAVYFAGSAIGGWMGKLRITGRDQAIERGFFRLGAIAVSVAIATKLAYWLARDAGLVPSGRVDALYLLTSPFQKLPPSPTYVALYGGVGLLMTGCLLMAHRRRIPVIVDWLSLLGRTSLFVFLLQFYVYYLAFDFIRFPFQHLWPIYYVLSVAFITLCARAWEKSGYNRWFNLLDWIRLRPTATAHPVT